MNASSGYAEAFTEACPAELTVSDLEQYVAVDEIARLVGHNGEMIELWKSAPYLLNFMKGYKLKERLEDRSRRPEVAAAVRAFKKTLLKGKTVYRYEKLDPANARMGALMRELLDGEQWSMLWVPPSLFSRGGDTGDEYSA